MIVIDASVIVKWFVREPDSSAALALSGETLAAPSIWITEVANVLWDYTRRGELSLQEAAIRVSRLKLATITSVAPEIDIDQAFALASEVSHAIYDCLYLAVAVRENAVMITADARFARAVRRHGRWASHLQLLGET
jgi:predicted nucleic acid-binding protein